MTQLKEIEASLSLRHSWSYLYLVFAAVSAFPIIIGVTSLPEKWWTVNRRESIDWIGATLITGAITLFAFSLTQSGVVVYGWKTPCRRDSSQASW